MPYPSKCKSQLKDPRTQIEKKSDDELLFNDVIVDVDDELYIIMRNENNENNEESDYYISDYDLTDNSGSEDEWSNIDLTNHFIKIISSSSSNNTNDIPSSSLNEPDIMPVFDVVSTANDINNEYSLPTLEHKIKNEKELDPRLQYTAQYLRLVNSDLLPGQQIPKEACVIIHPGANNEGYWNCDKMAKQLKEKAIPIFEAITNHGAYASDALLVNKMNLNPGGIQPKMRTTTMRDGTIQEMVFEDGTPK
ncbi:753_t:CDS:2, partial [Entrophospora sp. SA101]